MRFRLRNGTRHYSALIRAVKRITATIQSENQDAYYEFITHCKTGRALSPDAVTYLRTKRLVYPDKPQVAQDTKEVVDAMFNLVEEDGHVVVIVEVDPQA